MIDGHTRMAVLGVCFMHMFEKAGSAPDRIVRLAGSMRILILWKLQKDRKS
jgi:hypothetical protein